MKMHVAVYIEGAIKALKEGKNILDCSPNEALRLYTKAQAEGKLFYIGDSCDNQKPNGHCAGHEEHYA